MVAAPRELDDMGSVTVDMQEMDEVAAVEKVPDVSCDKRPIPVWLCCVRRLRVAQVTCNLRLAVLQCMLVVDGTNSFGAIE